MESQLRKICEHTLQDFLNYILNESQNKFKLNVIVKDKDVTFDPKIDYFIKILCDIVDTIVDAVGNIERLETQLYLDWSGQMEFLKPNVLEGITKMCKIKIEELFENEKIEPETKMNQLRENSRLYNGEEFAKVKNFLGDNSKTLEDNHNMIAYYHELGANLPIKIDKTVFIGLFEITQGDFIETIFNSVNFFKQLLIDSVVSHYQSKTKS